MVYALDYVGRYVIPHHMYNSRLVTSSSWVLFVYDLCRCVFIFLFFLQMLCCFGLLLLHPFNGLFSRTTWVSRHQKGKPFWILLYQEMIGRQWHQLDQMQIICTLLQTDNHASTLPLSFYRLDALPAAQPTASKHSFGLINE